MLTLRRMRPGESRPAPAEPAPEAAPADGEVMAGIGLRLRRARLVGGLSLKDLAFSAGISTGFLSYIETGRKVPSLTTLARLAAALGVPFSRLFSSAKTSSSAGERCLGSFARMVSESSPREKALWQEILHGYGKLVKERSADERLEILRGAAAVLYALRRAGRA